MTEIINDNSYNHRPIKTTAPKTVNTKTLFPNSNTNVKRLNYIENMV